MKNKINFLISLLFGLMFINAGLDKFFNYMPKPIDLPQQFVKVMSAFLEIGWLIPLVACVEIISGFLFILPKTRALGAIVIFPVMVGILLTNIFDFPMGLPVVIVLLAVNLWMLYDNRIKYQQLINH